MWAWKKQNIQHHIVVVKKRENNLRGKLVIIENGVHITNPYWRPKVRGMSFFLRILLYELLHGSYADDMSSRRAMLICPTLAFASLRSSSPLLNLFFYWEWLCALILQKPGGNWRRLLLESSSVSLLPKLSKGQGTLLRHCKQAHTQKKASLAVLKS